MKTIQNALQWGVLGLLLFSGSSEAAKNASAPVPVPVSQPAEVKSPVRLLQFSLAQRFTFRENQGGPNLSWIPSWEPELTLGENWAIRTSLGASAMTSNVGMFPVFRVLTGLTYSGLSANFFPEAVIGVENWAISQGGLGLAAGMNFHRALSWTESSWLRGFRSLYLGFLWVSIPDRPAYQVNLGVRWGGH